LSFRRKLVAWLDKSFKVNNIYHPPRSFLDDGRAENHTCPSGGTLLNGWTKVSK